MNDQNEELIEKEELDEFGMPINKITDEELEELQYITQLSLKKKSFADNIIINDLPKKNIITSSKNTIVKEFKFQTNTHEHRFNPRLEPFLLSSIYKNKVKKQENIFYNDKYFPSL